MRGRFIITMLFAAIISIACFMHFGKAKDAPSDVSAQPVQHAELMKKLNSTIQLQWKDVTVAEALRKMSDSLGALVYIEPERAKHIKMNRSISLITKEPVSHLTAIRMLCNHMGGPQPVFIPGEGRIGIGSLDTVGDRKVLQVHDLRQFAGYTTTMRREIIEEIQTDIEPNSWGSGHGWIQPSRSILSINVYNTVEVQRKIQQFCQSAWTRYFRKQDEKDVNQLANITFFEPKPTDKDKEELVKKLREKYKFKSIAPQLEYEAKRLEAARQEIQLSDAAKSRLAERETRHEKSFPFRQRSESLKLLHEAKVKDFIGRPGNGLSRVPPPGPSHLYPMPTPSLPLAKNSSNSFNEVPTSIPNSAADVNVSLRLPTKDRLLLFHNNSEYYFSDKSRMGYFKDREHVSGFEGHAFTQTPKLRDTKPTPWYVEPVEQWAVGRLQLVSLLKHDKPAVYVTDHLPRMDELDDVETRDLNAFENSALAKLFQGEDVVARATTNHIHMVGSIRTLKQCTKCHDTKRGELLGAFSYTLFRDPAIDPRKIESAAAPVQ